MWCIEILLMVSYVHGKLSLYDLLICGFMYATCDFGSLC